MSYNKLQFADCNIEAFDAIVVGSGFAGSVLARELAERSDKKVLVIEKRSHIAGNMYDEFDKAGILVHRYGPHIFHSNDKRAFDYLQRFCEWRHYEHEVLADLNGTYIPVPFNKIAMNTVFGQEKAGHLIDKLISVFGDERKVTINELRSYDDEDLSFIADFIYKNVFLYYTQKQWGLSPEEVDPSVTARVPVFVSEDCRYFQDEFQGLPADGYTSLFENMLNHENITVCLNTESENVFMLDFETNAEDCPLSCIKIKNEKFSGPIIYTGPLDELFLQRFGRLPYRSLDFVYETHDKEHVLPCGTVNYTVSEDYTRITEFKYLSGQLSDKTSIMKEYSCAYEDTKKQIPYYAIISDENNAHYQKYLRLTENLENFYPIGRLAEYRYYNMDTIISRALELADKLCR